MRNRIAAAAAAGILTIGMAALPSAASASEIAPNADGLAGSTTISGQIDQDMAVCTDKTCDAVQHVRKTNQQIKSDMETAKQRAEQLHQNAHEDADALRQYGEQAWKNYQQDREDVKNAIDGAVKRGQERHNALHQDMQDTQAHLNQMHADMKETHDELKTRHDAFAASSHQWHQSFIAALKDANSRRVSRAAHPLLPARMASRLERMPVRPLLESTAPLALCARLPTLARMVLQLDPSQLPAIKPPRPPAR